MTVRNSLLERFSGKFRRCWKIIPRFSGSANCYPCQGLGTFRQRKRLLENWPRLRERCWIFSSETATAFLSSSENLRKSAFWALPVTLGLSPQACPEQSLTMHFGQRKSSSAAGTHQMHQESLLISCCRVLQTLATEKGVITKGVFSVWESLESLNL